MFHEELFANQAATETCQTGLTLALQSVMCPPRFFHLSFNHDTPAVNPKCFPQQAVDATTAFDHFYLCFPCLELLFLRLQMPKNEQAPRTKWCSCQCCGKSRRFVFTRSTPYAPTRTEGTSCNFLRVAGHLNPETNEPCRMFPALILFIDSIWSSYVRLSYQSGVPLKVAYTSRWLSLSCWPQMHPATVEDQLHQLATNNKLLSVEYEACRGCLLEAQLGIFFEVLLWVQLDCHG